MSTFLIPHLLLEDGGLDQAISYSNYFRAEDRRERQSA